MYLIREDGKKKSAHIWKGNDTACRMWSTGGLNTKKKWIKSESALNLPICTMCANNERGTK